MVGMSAGYWLARYLAPQHSSLVLEDKVVVITGASSGIGRELALAFAQRGSKVVLVARREEQLEHVRKEIEPYAAAVLIIPADLTDDAQIKTLVQTVLNAFGQIDVLINNAGIAYNGYLHEIEPTAIREMVDVNLAAVIRLTQEVLPHMLVQRRGYIVNLGSSVSKIATPLFSTYTATKFAITGFSDSLRRELKGTGIRVMLAMPTLTLTNLLHEGLRQGYAATMPIDMPDMVANRIVEALVRGERQIVFGGWYVNLVMFLERTFPRINNMAWRYIMNHGWEQVAENFYSATD